MTQKRLIDADNLKDTLLLEGNLGYIHTLQDVERCIDAAPTVLHECICRNWHSANEIPPLHHVVEDGDDDEEPLEYESSEKLLVYTENGRTVSSVRYVKSENFVGWDDWSGGLFNTKVTHWMPQSKPPMEVQKNG